MTSEPSDGVSSTDQVDDRDGELWNVISLLRARVVEQDREIEELRAIYITTVRLFLCAVEAMSASEGMSDREEMIRRRFGSMEYRPLQRDTAFLIGEIDRLRAEVERLKVAQAIWEGLEKERDALRAWRDKSKTLLRYYRVNNFDACEALFDELDVLEQRDALRESGEVKE